MRAVYAKRRAVRPEVSKDELYVAFAVRYLTANV